MSIGRDNWGSRLAFILAASGSAIGLGNIWRFPTVAARNGGGAFVQVYLLFVILLGFIVMVGEITLGRRTQRNPVGVFRELAPRSLWVAVGFLGVAAGWGILSYYSVVAGWTLSYVFTTAGGTFSSGISAENIDLIFLGTIASPARAIFWHFIFILLTVGVVMGGVKQGIERWSKILMPMLFILLVLLVVRSMTLENASIGLKKYLSADWSKVTGSTLIAALGQAFFSLSLGMGTMITYGSYMHRNENIVRSAGWVCFSDTLIAVLAGLAIFPALYSMPGVEPEVGAKLIFIVLPGLFSKIPFGTLFGTGFFLLLSVAALTSSISLLEVPVAYFVDERRWPRRRAAVVSGLIAFVLGIFSALSLGAVDGLSGILKIGPRTLGFLDLMDLTFGQFSLTLGALLIALFIGWKWGARALVDELSHQESGGRLSGFIAFQIRYVCPLVLIALLLYLILNPNAFA
ncbi:MAG: sodium-dependent transporter [Candidatus Glassbacteria bacterium]|nr:sodium-dependent transporter [Candidatus Glassbacteria bacterium]